MKSSDDYDYPIEPAVLGGGDVGKIDWVIRDFLARGAFVLLAAEFGSGKSTLIYRTAEAIYKGDLFLDQLPTSKGKVLVIQGDEPPADAVKKFRRMGLETPFEIFYANPPLDLDWLEKQIRSKVYVAILIDSMTTLFATNSLDVIDLGFPRKLYRIGKAFAEANVGGLISCHLNKPNENKIRSRVTRHDIQGVATIGAAVTDLWGMWRQQKPEWDDHYNLLCLGKRHCKEGILLKLQGNEEDFYWSFKEVGNGLMPQEKIYIEEKISNHFLQSPEPLSLDDIAKRLNTSYEYARRICTEMYDRGLLYRIKVETGQKGRPTYKYSYLLKS